MLVCVLLLLVFVSPIKVKGTENNVQKVYCKASINDKFIENQILVVLNKEKSLNGGLNSRGLVMSPMNFICVKCGARKIGL